MVLRTIALALLAEGRRARVKGPIDTGEVTLAHAKLTQLGAQSGRVGALHRAITTIATAVVGWADGAASGVRDRSPAGRTGGDGHADVSPQLALDANAVSGRHGPAADEESGNHLDQLSFVDRTAAQLEIHRHMLGDGRRCRQRVDIVGARIDDRRIVSDT